MSAVPKELKALSKKFPLPHETHELLMGLRDESDRSAALVCGALLDAALQRVIMVHIKTNSKTRDGLFRVGGPLGNFSGKILVASAYGTISSNLARELDIVREVRNAFAHSIMPMDFAMTEVQNAMNRSTIFLDLLKQKMALPVEMTKIHFLVITRTVFYFLQLRFAELGGGKLGE